MRRKAFFLLLRCLFVGFLLGLFPGFFPQFFSGQLLMAQSEEVSDENLPSDQEEGIEPLLVTVFPALQITEEGAIIPAPLTDQGENAVSESSEVTDSGETETEDIVNPLLEEVNFSAIFTQSIQNEYQSAGYSVDVINSWLDFLDEDDDVQGTLSVDYANERNSDIAVVTFFQLEGRRLTIMVKAYDVRRKKLISANVSTGRNDLSALNIVDRMMVNILRDLEAEEEDLRFMKENPGTLIGTAATKIVFESDQEGMEVLLPGGQSLGFIEDGVLELPYQTLALGQTIEVEKKAPGFYPDTEENVLSTQNEVYRLAPLYPKAFGTVFFEWNAQKLLGISAGMRAYLVPDFSFIHLGVGIYWQSLGLPNTKPVFHQSFELMLGSYLFFLPSDFFRISYAFGFGMEMTFFTSNFLPVYNDFYLNIASLQFELNFQSFMLYLRSDVKFALASSGGSLLDPGTGSFVPLAPLTIGVAIKW